MQFGLESLASRVQTPLDRANGGSQVVSDLDQRLTFDVEGDQSLAVKRLEPVETFVETLRSLAGNQLFERVVVDLARPFKDFGLDRRWGQFTSRSIDRHPRRDLTNPTGEPFGLAKLVDPLHDVQEDFLSHLDRLARVAEPSEADRVDGSLELFYQPPERLTVASLSPTDQERQVAPLAGIRAGPGLVQFSDGKLQSR